MKPKLKKLISILLALCLLASLSQIAAFAEDALPKLTLGKSAAIVPYDAASDTYYAYYTFTPETSGEYLFYSEQVTLCDPYLEEIYDADGNYVWQITGDSNDYNYRDFRVVYELTAGVEYTLTFQDYCCTSDGFYVNIEKYCGITEQPTGENPTVSVNNADEVKSYQWYTLKHETVTVTDKTASVYYYPAFNDDGNYTLLKSAYDSATQSWTGIKDDNGDGTYLHCCFFIELEAGCTLTVEASDEIIDYDVWFDDVTVNGKTLTATADYSGMYYVDIKTESENTTVKASYEKWVTDEKAANQTTDTLTSYEQGKYYKCAVTYNNGTVSTSYPITVGKQITHQPNWTEPYVTVTYPSDVKSYQWYEVTEEKNYITDESENLKRIFSSRGGTAAYDTTTQKWTGTIVNSDWGFFTVSLKAGDVLIVKADSEVGENSYLKSGETYASSLIGIDDIVFWVEEDGDYDLFVEVSDRDEQISVYTSKTDYAALADQTSAELTKYEEATEYACIVTYNDNSTLTSDITTIERGFTHHPTDTEPYVTVTYPSDVKSYEWYEVTEEKNYITDESENVTVFSFDEKTASYNSNTEVWSGVVAENYDDNGTNGHVYFTIQLKASDILIVDASDDILEGSCLKDVTSRYEAGVLIGDNRAVFIVTEDGDYTLGIATNSTDTTISAHIIRTTSSEIEGQTTNTLTSAENGKNYRCTVEYNDGEEFYSIEFGATTTTEVILEFNKYNADTVTVADKTGIQKLLDDTTELLKDTDLSPDRQNILNNIKTQAALMLTKINASTADDKIASLLPSDITLDNADAVRAAQNIYNALTDEEKSLLNSDTVKKLNDALATLAKLQNAANTNPGGNLTQTGDSSNLTFWLAALLVSGFVLAAAVYGKKKSVKKN